MTRRDWTLGGLALAAVVLLFNTVFVVGQTRQAVVLRFGEPVAVINAAGRTPGVQLKIPFIETVAQQDRRNQSLEVDREEIITSDQERLVVDAFVRYRISDPLSYFRTLRTERDANDRLERMVNSSLRQVLGSATSSQIISGRRAQLTAITRSDLVNRVRAARYGVTIIDVRIIRVDLPQANQQAVFDRMTTNLQQQAAQIRYDGDRQRREVVANADREVTVIQAEATAQAGAIRGQGDAQATALYNASFGRDPAFAAFFRSMQAYETSLRDDSTTMVLSPDSEFFRYFQRGSGGASGSTRR